MKKIWGAFWTVMALLGMYVLWSTWRLPSESKNIFMLGMSKSKLALCGGIAVMILLCLAGAVFSFTGKENSYSNGKAAGIAAYIVMFGLILAMIFLQPPVGRTSLERSLLERLRPLIYWGTGFVLLAAIALLTQNIHEIIHGLTSSLSPLVWGALVLLFMTCAIILALHTGIGLDPISGTFYRQGVSLLEGHLVVPLLFLYPLFPLFMKIGPKTSGKRSGTILSFISAILIWAAAVWLWQTTEFEGRSYFAPALRPPNYNYYPASDAENYDLLAQSVLLGNGFRNGMTVVRPLYAAFLALLHAIFKNDYIQLTNGQILLLALIPVIIFLIGKHLRHTAAGLLAAVWAIWREIYSIRLTPLVQVSNSRLLMSDLPTLLMVTLSVLYIVKWYRYEKEPLYALLSGGMIGIAMLLRTQCFVLIPALIVLFLFSSKKPSKKWLSILISLLGLGIVFGPWTIWGRLHPNTTANAEVSEGQYLQQLYRTATGEANPNTGLWQVIQNHPAETMQAVGSHFLNNEISSLLVLPVRLIKPKEADQLFYEGDLFWYRENARETIEKNIPLIGVYLTIITFGIIAAVRKNGIAGMVPLAIHVVYNLGNAFAMTSGWRFILPSDWVILFYFALGAAAVLEFVNRLFLFDFSVSAVSNPGITETATRSFQSGWAFAGTILLLVLIGAILPLCETVIPRRFTPKTQVQLEIEWIQSAEEPVTDLSKYSNEQVILLEGRAIYPRLYTAGEGDSGGSSSAKRGLDIDRLVWMFHDDRVQVLCLPLNEDQAKTAFTSPVPDPMDVLVVGIQREDYIEVLDMKQLEPGE